MIKAPPSAQDGGELCNAHEIRGFRVERIEPDRDLFVSWCNHDLAVAEMLLVGSFLLRNRAKEKRRRIAMQIKPHEATTRLDVFPTHVPEQRTLAAPGFSHDPEMGRPTSRTHRDAGAGDHIIDHCKPERKPRHVAFSVAPVAYFVPDSCEEMVEYVRHE